MPRTYDLSLKKNNISRHRYRELKEFCLQYGEKKSDRNHKCIYLSDEETTEYCVDGPCPKFKTESQIKAEAVKEFAEIVKANKNSLFNYIFSNKGFDKQINNLVKEMVGDMK